MLILDYIQLNIVDRFLYLQQDLKNLNKKKKAKIQKKKKDEIACRLRFN